MTFNHSCPDCEGQLQGIQKTVTETVIQCNTCGKTAAAGNEELSTVIHTFEALEEARTAGNLYMRTTPLTLPPGCDPHNVMCVVKLGDKVVGRIPATSQNVQARLISLRKQHGAVTVEFEEDENASLLAMLSGPPRRLSHF